MAKKKNGIKGRPSNATIQKRKDICLDLRKIYPLESINTFLNLLKKEYQKNGIELPLDQTIKSNLKEWGIDFKNPQKINIEHTNFHTLGKEIQTKLRQIRVSFKTVDIVLFDYDKVSKYKFDKFKESGFVYEDKKDFLNRFITLVDQKKRPLTTLLYVSIILREKGLEKYIENIFDNNFLSPKPYLYIETHDYCTKIIFEYKNYEQIMDSVFKMVENYSYNDFNLLSIS